MTGPVLRRVVTARLFGVSAMPMGLEYRTADPAAITLTLATCSAENIRTGREPIAPGTGGRHRRHREPSLAGLVLRRLLAQTRRRR